MSTTAEAVESETDGALAQYARRAPRISQADVFRAADELLLEGHRPTIDRVRIKLGRGSPNTINDHLDDWWSKLGSRLRDLPGRQFPQVSERVGKALLLLWTEAVSGAHESLQEGLAGRERQLQELEARLAQQSAALAVEQQALTLRASTVDDSVSLAREQMAANYRRAEQLEGVLASRDGELVALRQRLDALTQDLTTLTAQQNAEREAHRFERIAADERHAATEARWLREVDQARQAAKQAQQALLEVRSRGSAAKADQTVPSRRPQAKATVATSRGGAHRTAAAKRARTRSTKYPRRKSSRS